VIRVLLVDDDPSCLEGLRQVLGLDASIQVVGEATTVEAALRLQRSLEPDVVVIDADLPSEACLNTMRDIASGRMSGPAFVCLAMYPDHHDAALAQGARSFLRKDCSPRDLLAAVHCSVDQTECG
jgi:two-component system nitrate/nitrite response regulator NarL